MTTTKLDSAADERTQNNAVRHTYRTLIDAEKEQMMQIKDAGAAFISMLHAMGGTQPGTTSFASRDLALANTHIEDAVMRAVRHLTA